MEITEKMNEILLEMERFRQEHEWDSLRNPDWFIRHCQAIVAEAAGYKIRLEWSGPIEEQVSAERKKKALEDYYEERLKGADVIHLACDGIVYKIRKQEDAAGVFYDIFTRCDISPFMIPDEEELRGNFESIADVKKAIAQVA
jgi:hypothetical protein